MSRLSTFKLTEKDLQPGCREIDLEGELDLAVADRLTEALDRAVSEQDRIVIGLERCTFIDSTGIAVIVKAHRELAQQGGALTVYGASDQVLRILFDNRLDQRRARLRERRRRRARRPPSPTRGRARNRASAGRPRLLRGW